MDHSGQIAAAGADARESLERTHQAREAALVALATRHPHLRDRDPRRAPPRVPRGARAGGGSGGVRRRDGRRGRGASRCPLHGLRVRRQEGVRGGQPHVRVRRRPRDADGARARRRRAGVPQRHGRGGERAASPGARPAARRRRRGGRTAARVDGRRVHAARDRRLPRRHHRRPAAHDRRPARRARAHPRRRHERAGGREAACCAMGDPGRRTT